MKITSIEPTPNPNNMKLNLDESLGVGEKFSYGPEANDAYPEYANALLKISGLIEIFHTGNFMSVKRHPSADWEKVLEEVRKILGEEVPAEESRGKNDREGKENWGEVKVFVQYFRGLPMLVKVQGENEESRAALPTRFADAVEKASAYTKNMLIERKWVIKGSRYGDLGPVAENVAEEIDAAYDQERLERLVSQAFSANPNAKEELKKTPKLVLQTQLRSSDWKKRFSAVDQIGANPLAIPQLTEALKDPAMSIRRLATVFLGLIEKPEVIAPLCSALKDDAAAVRRTAGDALNDIGNPDAQGAMAEALKDSNKIVRWRAARFLYELGDETSLPMLKSVKEDSAFEVKLQIAQAIERIEGGGKAQVPAWRQLIKK